MHRIAVLDDYQNAALAAADWESLAGCMISVFNRHLGDEDAVEEALRNFDIIVCMRERTPFPASLLERLPNLKLLVTTGLRNFSIDMAAARQLGVTVSGTEMLGYPAFEHTWALILAVTKQISFEDRTMKSGGWQQGYGVGLNGKILGVVGLGKLGSKVARVGLAFDMEVVAWSENLTDERAVEVGVRRVDKETLFREADIVTIHQVLSDRTRGLVGGAELGAMRPTAFIVNTSRGPIIDEAALIQALETGTIAGAGLDVYETEPLPADHRLRQLDNVVLTGHTGFVVRELHELAYGQAVDNIAAWLKGEPIRVLNAPED